MKTRIWAIAGKEIIHVTRDWRTLLMSFGLPLLMVILFGYAITFDIRDIRLAIYDADKSIESRELISKFSSSEYFKIVSMAGSDKELGDFMDAGTAQIALSIPNDFSKMIGKGETISVAVIVDGAESNTANIASGYIQAILAGRTLEYSMETLSRQGISQLPSMPPVELQPRYWYNSELRSQNFIIPGLIATIMMIMTALLTSLCIVGERERGTMEQLISTPVKTYEIIIGKLIPYFIIGFVDSLIIAGVGVAVMGVPFVGSIGLFLLGTAVFALAGLGIGIRISTAAKNQVMAMQMAILISMLPSYLLSGFMFAVKSMPDWVQVITYLVPAKYFLTILRGVFLKDMGMNLLWPQFVLLMVLAFVLFAISIKTFKKKIG